MKKIFLILIILLGILLVSQKDKYDLTKDMIRFRVIASTNSVKDIKMKELVVNELSKIIFNGSNDSINDKREQIINNMSNIENKIDDLFKSNNYNETFNMSYGLNHFPEKEYEGIKFKEGDYESLVIEIGEGKGNNYWCILYPPLCMIDEDNKNIEYKSKLLETLKELF